jgi:hypothetical protein
MGINITSDMRTSKGIAMAIAPFDKGNVRYNAIKSIRTNRGFRIGYSLEDAFYIYFLEEGTRHSRSNVGFIGNRTVPTIASYLYAKYASNNKSKVNRFRYVARNVENNINISEQRNLQHQQSLKLDVNQIAMKNGWKHEVGCEIFDPDFKERSL